MVAVDIGRMREMTALLLRLFVPQRGMTNWSANDKGKEKTAEGNAETLRLPSLDQGLVVFRLFRYVFVTRAMRKNSLFAQSAHRSFWAPWAKTNRGLGSTNNTENNWVHLLSVECADAYHELQNRGHIATHFMALFAAGGLLYVSIINVAKSVQVS